MHEVLPVAALVVSLVTLLLLLRVAGRRGPTEEAQGTASRTAPVAAPAVAPSPPAGAEPDAALLVRLDLLEAKVSVLEARSAQPVPATPLPRADDDPDADDEPAKVRRPHPMFP